MLKPDEKWDDILASEIPWAECYPRVGMEARAILNDLKDEVTVNTSWLIYSMGGKGSSRRTKSRMSRALRALAAHADGLKGYHFTAEGANHFRPGEMATQYYWHKYKAPPPKQYCSLCGQELPEEKDNVKE